MRTHLVGHVEREKSDREGPTSTNIIVLFFDSQVQTVENKKPLKITTLIFRAGTGCQK
jgi:hypothetical protein